MHAYTRNTYYLVLFIVAILHTNTASAQRIIGWVNSAEIYPEKLIVHARMDTGTKTSSLRGKSINIFTQKGENWLSMEISDKKGHAYSVKYRIVRFTKIKQHAGVSVRRPVIMLGICVSDIYKEVEVSVVERAGFNYPLLIGRNFLAGSFLIDSSKTFTAKPVCRQ